MGATRQLVAARDIRNGGSEWERGSQAGFVCMWAGVRLRKGPSLFRFRSETELR